MNEELKEFLFGFRLFGRDPKYKAKQGLFGYQMAGQKFTDQTSLNAPDYVKGVLTGWFQWPEAEAKQLADGMAEVGMLSGEAIRTDGVYLTSPDGREQYHFIKIGRSWNVKRIRPDKPILKD